ncbi:MAG: hypothetical protein LUG94_08070 [Ruminococcus sp.]|nr:hypothetical protein [Ruminococcus sp.]
MFYDNLKKECEKQGTTISKVVVECGGKTGSIDGWKKGAMPNSKIVMQLSLRLNVTTDYLLFGRTQSQQEQTFSNNNTTVSQLNVGALGNNSNGHVTIRTKQEKYEYDELTQEMISAFQKLSTSEKIELIHSIYQKSK